MQPSPAPRFSRTQSELTLTPAHAGQHTREVLEICGFAAADIDALVASGAVKEA
jgi:alpha-methylacyl-CoA racemase